MKDFTENEFKWERPFGNFKEFIYTPILPYEEGITRRDPSPVILVDNTYYLWYSRSTLSSDGYSAYIWYAISSDGKVWQEQGEVLPKGPAKSFDEHGVFTPTILMAKGEYYLFYTAAPEPFTNDKGGPGGTRTAIGLATSHSPHGPWKRQSSPVLLPSEDPDKFDSMRIDDACLLIREGEYWMYYKGRQMNHSPRSTKMGLAIAKNPSGPYVKYHANPVLDSGHEVCIWPHGEGVGCLVCHVGPQGNTLQYSKDGIHFQQIIQTIPPKAPGPFRSDLTQRGTAPGITWGISMIEHPQWPYLVRFDCDLRSII